MLLGLSWSALLKGLAAILCALGVISLALIYFIPTPPTKIAIATSVIKGTTYQYYAQRYRERFARANVKLELRESPGSVETLGLLQDAGSEVQLAFMYGGISDGEHALGLLSIFWIFYSSAVPLERLSQLKGKRIAVGPAGTAVRQAAEHVLGTDGITAETATFLPIAGTAAVEALRDGKLDAYWMASAPESPAVQTMLRMPSVRLMSFARAEALTRIFPNLVRLTLPQGVFDIAANIPPNDVSLIATTVRILIRDDLHPQIVSLLLQTLIKEHGGPGIFQRAGEFPTQTDPGISYGCECRRFLQERPIASAKAFAVVANCPCAKGDRGAGHSHCDRHPAVQFRTEAIPLVFARPDAQVVSPPQGCRKSDAKKTDCAPTGGAASRSGVHR
jgi:TRAP-type uncharacterized transport system substrate-binding protein